MTENEKPDLKVRTKQFALRIIRLDVFAEDHRSAGDDGDFCNNRRKSQNQTSKPLILSFILPPSSFYDPYYPLSPLSPNYRSHHGAGGMDPIPGMGRMGICIVHPLHDVL